MQVKEWKSDRIFGVEQTLRKLRLEILVKSNEVEVEEAKIKESHEKLQMLEKHESTLFAIGKKYGICLDSSMAVDKYFDRRDQSQCSIASARKSRTLSRVRKSVPGGGS